MMIASRSLRMVSIVDLAAHHDRAAAEMIGRADALAAENDAAGREIRTRHDVDEIVDAERGIVDQRDAGVDDFAEIVRRDVGRHADGDAAGAVDQKVRKLRRQDRRLVLGIVVVGLEIDGVLVDIVEHRERRSRQARFGVAHTPPADRRRPSRNCPGRRSAARAWRNPAPCAPSRRRSTGRRADDIYRSRRRRRAPTSRTSCPACVPARTSSTGCAGAPASGRRAHPAAHAPRSRSWRNRGRSASSRRGWIRDEYRRAPAARRACYLRCRTKGNPVTFLARESYSRSGALKPPLNGLREAVFPFVFSWTYARSRGLPAPEMRPRTRPPEPAISTPA